MHKSFNTMKGGYAVALENLRRHGMRLYVTFIVGYDGDSHESLDEMLRSPRSTSSTSSRSTTSRRSPARRSTSG